MGSPDHGSVAPSRRAFLGGAAALGATAALPAWPTAARSARGHFGRDGFRVSLSVSPFTEAVVGAVPLTDGRRRASTVQEVQQLFSRHGATCLRFGSNGWICRRRRLSGLTGRSAGWVEHSEIHHFSSRKVMGFARAQPILRAAGPLGIVAQECLAVSSRA